MNIGDKIKELRLQNGLTLEQLGDKVGVGKSTVRKWECGMIQNMKRDKIAKLADALNTTPAFLMGWDENENKEPEAITQAIDTVIEWSGITQLRKIIGIVKALNDDGISELLKQADLLSKNPQYSPHYFEISEIKSKVHVPTLLEQKFEKNYFQSLIELDFKQETPLPIKTFTRTMLLDYLFTKNNKNYYFEISTFRNFEHLNNYLIGNMLFAKSFLDIKKNVFVLVIFGEIPSAQELAIIHGLVLWEINNDNSTIYFPSKEVEEEFYRK